ncbi:MAG: hypothetical protein ACKO9T_10770, partial [Nitrospira sp.]
MLGLAGVGLAGALLESDAADVYLEATRPDFQKIPIGVLGFQDGTVPAHPGTDAAAVLAADLRRSQVFAVAETGTLGVGLPATGEPDKSKLTQAVGAAPEGADPRPLGRAPARPLQPHAAGRGPLGGQTVALRQPMNLSSPGGAYGGVVNDTIVGGMAGGVPGGV